MADITLGGLAIDCPNPPELATFYSKLLGLQMNGEDAILTPEGQEIWFQPVENYQFPTWSTQERGQQMHLDISVDDLDTAVSAAKKQGATLAPNQPGDGWRVMLDPAGHPFCLVPSSGTRTGGQSGIGNWTSLTIDCADGEELAGFYHALFGMELTDHGGGFFSLSSDSEPSINFQPVEGYQAPTWPTQERGQQMHFDFTVDDTGSAQAHAISLGASLVDDEQDRFHVFLDPAGHPFCLCRPE